MSSFIKQYYEIMTKTPENLYRFYNEESSFSHVENPQAMDAGHSGVENIRAAVAASSLGGCFLDLSEGTVQCQRSENGGIVVQVTGSFTRAEERPHLYVQTFFLAAQSKGFFVRNSMFRILSASGGSGEAELAAQRAQQAELEAEVSVLREEKRVRDEEEKRIKEKKMRDEEAKRVKEAEKKAKEEEKKAKEEEKKAKEEADKRAKEEEQQRAKEEEEKRAKEEQAKEEQQVQEEVPIKQSSSADRLKAMLSVSTPASSNKSYAELLRGTIPQEEEVEKVEPVQPKQPTKSKPIKNTKSVPVKPPTRNCTIYMSQIPADATVDDVDGLCSPFGTIKKMDNFYARGFAFIEFDEEISMSKLLNQYAVSPCDFNINGQSVTVQEKQVKKNDNHQNKRDKTNVKSAGGKDGVTNAQKAKKSK